MSITRTKRMKNTPLDTQYKPSPYPRAAKRRVRITVVTTNRVYLVESKRLRTS